MEAFLVSTGLVAVAEIGDKTQLLAILLAARFRKPVPIILGILLFVVAAFYALDVVRGGHGEDEGANAGDHFDWKTIGALCAVFVANALLIDWLGWVISGSILFWGSAIVLGSRRYFVTLAAAIVLALGTFYGFAIGLGLGLPAGVLQGIL